MKEGIFGEDRASQGKDKVIRGDGGQPTGKLEVEAWGRFMARNGRRRFSV